MNYSGLSEEEVKHSRYQHGDNALSQQPEEPFLEKLYGNFDDPIIRILCVALAINVFFAILGQTKWYESVGIALAVVLATFISTYSEYKNESAFQKLQEEASQIRCKVYRNGKVAEIPIDEIVKGDYVLLQAGDKIPADGILVKGSIHVDQSVLNGESKECKKTASNDLITEDLEKSQDFLYPHKIFRGSIVANGNAVFIVTTVGDFTVYGGIASELQSGVDRDTPLKVKLNMLAKQISKFGYIGGVGIAAAYLFQRIIIQNAFNQTAIMDYCSNYLQLGNDVVDAVMLAVIIIVMAVPEGLPLMIAIVSAQNMGKMLKDNVLVRKVSGIETAGSLNILFTDKTGTITKGKLEVTSFIDGAGHIYDQFNGIPSFFQNTYIQEALFNTSSVVSDNTALGGNATERAILGFIPALDNITMTANRLHHVTAAIPFNSTNKFSAVQIDSNQEGEKNAKCLIKGAPETILPLCNTQLDVQGEEITFDATAVNETLDRLAQKSIRVLAFAQYRGELKEDGLPKQLTFIGAVGIRDELREESKTAINQVHHAGVHVVMITGDRQETAEAIAKEAGLITEKRNLVLTSKDLAAMDDQTVMDKLPQLAVVARALPADKSRLVKLAQRLGLVVGMTGDGVNDSPALKAADVGFAMGGGTEVAKEASEVVILDDNFKSIAKAILYGRTIFNSIRKFIIFQLTINLSAVIISFICPLIGMENPLTITQILWVNLVMDTLAALAFGGEPALTRYMEEIPKRRDEHIINHYMGVMILCGTVVTLFISKMFLFNYGIDFETSAAHMTGFFTIFILISVFNAFCIRSDTVNPFSHINENPGFLRVMALIFVVQVIMTQYGGDVLRCSGLNPGEWAFTIALAFFIVPVMLIVKLLSHICVK